MAEICGVPMGLQQNKTLPYHVNKGGTQKKKNGRITTYYNREGEGYLSKNFRCPLPPAQLKIWIWTCAKSQISRTTAAIAMPG